MEDVAVEPSKVSSAKPVSIVDAFGLEKLLSTGLKTELVAMEAQVKRSKSEGLVYTMYLKIAKDLVAQNMPGPAGFTHAAVLDFYKL